MTLLASGKGTGRPLAKKLLTIMNLTGVLLIVATLSVSAKSFSQKITLSGKNFTLQSIFKSIERQTGFQFVYERDILAKDTPAAVNFENVELRTVLSECLASRHLSFSIANNIIVVTRIKLSPESERFHASLFPVLIKGTVLNENAEPLSGATVTVKETGLAVKTDNLGNFQLQMEQGHLIIVSYVGYQTQELKIAGEATLSIVLKVSAVESERVVVIGYGTQRKRDLTGAVSQIKAEDIRGIAATGFDQAIQGKVAGVSVVNNSGEPGGNVSVKIRGIGTINGSSEPLYVVDGIPVEGGLNTINPNDIETIDIMKDASAAAIYGSRASNGVVIITTRQGKTGKLQVDLDAYYGVQSMAKKLSLLNTSQFFTLSNEAFANQKADPRYSNTPAALTGPNPGWTDPSQWANTNWQDEISQNGTIQSYNISMSGGSKAFRSATMFGYYKLNGVLINSDYDRFSLRSNNSYDVKKWLRGGFTVGLSRESRHTINSDRTETGDPNIGAIQLATRAAPYQPVYANDGYGSGLNDSVFYGFNGYAFLGRRSINDAAGQFYYAGNALNPVYALSSNIVRPSSTWRSLAGTYLELEPITGLKLRTTLNGDFNSGSELYGQAPIDPETNVNEINGVAYLSSNKDLTWNWINTLSFDKKIGSHAITALAGTDALKYTSTRTSITATGFAPGEQFVPDNAVQRSVSSYEISNSLVSYFGRITYAYASKYLAAFNVRRDGSSRFGPSNRWGTFPSASVGWRVSQESFLKGVKAINELKVRASYGILGNQRIPDFKYLSTYSARDNVGYAFFPVRYPLGPTTDGYQSTQPGIALTNLANASIKWEASSQLDFGADASLLDNQLTITIDYYKKKVYDLLGDEPVPVTFGSPTGSRFGNFASLENTGWEFTVAVHPRIGRVQFNIQANASTFSNKVTDIGNSSDISRSFGNMPFATTKTVVGEPIAQYYGFKTDGLYQNQTEVTAGPQMPVTVVPGDRRYKDISGPDGKPDGIIDDKDRVFLGNGFAKWSGGLNLQASFAGFDVTMFFSAQFGAKVAADWMRYAYDIRNFNGGGFQNASTEVLRRWQKEGDETDIPRLGYDETASNYYFSDFFVRKADFARLRNMQVGYTLSPKQMNRIGISKARIYISGQNLFTITNYNGYDPEIGVRGNDVVNGNSVLLSGVDTGRYPTSRVVYAGVNLTF